MQIDNDKLDSLVYYLHEREHIRIAKRDGVPRDQWTSDPILKTYKFTNVLREHDWTTQRLLEGWYVPHKEGTLGIILLNCAIARYFGTWEFCEDLGWQRDWNPENIRQLAALRMQRKQKVFTSAYVITNGGISDKKYNVVVDHYLSPFVRAIPHMVNVVESTGSFEKMAGEMMELPGFGGTGFMTKEVISDFILATRGRIDWQDLHTWSPVGPGAARGLLRLHGLPANANLPKKAALTALRATSAALAPRLRPHMPQVGVDYDLHAVQFACCELDKYLRAKSGEGKPKNTYTPR